MLECRQGKLLDKAARKLQRRALSSLHFGDVRVMKSFLWFRVSRAGWNRGQVCFCNA